mmetsp:Transcript_11943/g.34966  ORF Transcript_11943/g.34966 Transcript_11943/m.34966 type:complete len:84 (+) Transcript_11943:228-479(+)
MGAGNCCEQSAIDLPQVLGQVINFSKKLVMSFTKLRNASKGCSSIQTPAQRLATGHAMNTRRANQIIPKIGFFAILLVRLQFN